VYDLGLGEPHGRVAAWDYPCPEFSWNSEEFDAQGVVLSEDLGLASLDQDVEGL
jgi:hypothetical protein